MNFNPSLCPLVIGQSEGQLQKVIFEVAHPFLLHISIRQEKIKFNRPIVNMIIFEMALLSEMKKKIQKNVNISGN